MSEYNYNLIIVDENDEVEILSGTIFGSEPRLAARTVIESKTEWYESYCDALQPTITVERDSDGNFVVDVDSHGLGNAGIVLTKVS